MYKYEIGDDETCGELTERLSSGSAKQLILTLETIISDKAEVWEQNNQYATYTEKIETDSAELNWEMNPSTMHNFIRAHTPKPGVWFEDNNKRIKIYKTHLVEGKFVIDQLQIEGKKVCSLLELKNGYPAVFKALNEKVNKVNEE